MKIAPSQKIDKVGKIDKNAPQTPLFGVKMALRPPKWTKKLPLAGLWGPICPPIPFKK